MPRNSYFYTQAMGQDMGLDQQISITDQNKNKKYTSKDECHVDYKCFCKCSMQIYLKPGNNLKGMD